MGHLAICGSLLVMSAGGEGPIGIQWVEARDFAQHPTKQRTAPTTKNYPDLSVSAAITEKPSSSRDRQPDDHTGNSFIKPVQTSPS